MGPNGSRRGAYSPRPGERDRLKPPVVVWEGSVRRVVAVPRITRCDSHGTIAEVESRFVLEEARTNALGQKVWITMTETAPEMKILIEELALSTDKVPENWFKDSVPSNVHSMGPYR